MNDLEKLRKDFKYELTNRCVQCGYCLPVCPTYASMGKETHSPRGRINLVKMVGEGRISDLSVLEEPIDLCLGCRACETACPTGVEYGTLLEAAREVLVKNKKTNLRTKVLKNVLLKRMIPNHNVMNQVGNALWLYEKSGLQKTVRKMGVLGKFPAHLGTFEAIIPPAVSPGKRRALPKRMPADSDVCGRHQDKAGQAESAKKYTVAFFTGCIMDAMFRRINELSIQLLAKAGCEVIVVESQTCCGALHAHTGGLEDSIRLAKQNIAAFEKVEADYIVNNAGGCGAMLNEYHRLLDGEPKWADRARKFSAKSRDISQILVQCGGIPGLEHASEKVTYQRSCHMTNVQKVTKEPLELIRSIPNVELLEMKDRDMCCGSAGIYNIVNYEASMDILDKKMENVKDTKTTAIITTNPGCLLQMKLGIEREGLTGRMRALHLVEYLAEAAGLI